MEPIQFIATGELGNEFVVSPDALRILDAETRPVTVICIVGPYRTGKSYLLNRLMGRNNGFPLGPTLQAKTKGIWTSENAFGAIFLEFYGNLRTISTTISMAISTTTSTAKPS